VILKPFVDLSYGNVHYMVGLVVMGILLTMSIAVTTFLLYHNGYVFYE